MSKQSRSHIEQDHHDRKARCVIVRLRSARRVCLIAVPGVGSKLTSQTSPLSIDILAVESREERQLTIHLMLGQQRLSSHR